MELTLLSGLTLGDAGGIIELLLEFLAAFWLVLARMAPWLLFGFLFAGILSVLIRPAFVEKQLGGEGFLPFLKATLFGIPLPLCSCGVIPVTASLRRQGASRGAAASFLLATPQTGVDSIAVTWSLMGLVFTVFRVAAALANGIAAGWAVSLGDKREKENADKSEIPQLDTCPKNDSSCRSCAVGLPAGEGDGKNAEDKREPVSLKRMLEYGFVILPADIGKSLLVGLLVAGAIGVFLPPQLLAGVFSDSLSGRFLSMLVMLAVGIPVYVCATSSVPVAAMLIAKGISPGAALVFLMTGPASNAASIATIWKVLGKRATITYLAVLVISALCAGLLLDAVFPDLATTVPAMSLHEHGGSWLEHVAGISLAALLAYAVLSPYLDRLRRRLKGKKTGLESADTQEEGDTGLKVTLKIEGMTCSHCAATVKRTLEGFDSVREAEVDLHSGEAVVSGEGMDLPALCAAIGEVGYTAKQAGAD